MRTSRSHSWLSLCAVAAALTAVAPSAAQPLPGGSAPAKEDALSDTARDLFAKGAKAAEQQKWDQCRAALLAALSIKRHPQIAGNLAACEAKLGLYRDAAEHAAYFLNDMKPGTSTERRMSGQSILNESMGKIAAVTVVASVEGADVLVDGRSVGASPLSGPVFLDPGQHSLEARQEGYVTARVALDAKAGTTPAVTLRLERPETGGTTLPPPLPPPPPTPRPLWPLVVGAGVTVALLASGTGLAVAANAYRAEGRDAQQKIDDSGKLCGGGADPQLCTKLEDALGQTDSFRNLAIGAFVGAGVFAIATTVYGLLPPVKATVSQGCILVPMVGSNQAGVVFRAAF
jgi:hypothetical protein